MFQPITNKGTLITIRNDIKKVWGEMPVFGCDRLETLKLALCIVSSWFSAYAISNQGIASNSSELENSDQFILNIKKSLRAILLGLTASTNGTGTPQVDELQKVMFEGISYAGMVRVLNHMIKNDDIDGLEYDPDSKTLHIDYSSEQIQYGHILNSLSLKLGHLRRLKEYLEASKQLSELENETKAQLITFFAQRPESDLLHPSILSDEMKEKLRKEIELSKILEGQEYTINPNLSLNGRYTYDDFSNVMNGLYIIANILLLSLEFNKWKPQAVHIKELGDELSVFLKMDKLTVGTILADLSFAFFSEDLVDFQPLIQYSDRNILLIPLYVVDNPTPPFYIELSQRLYLEHYNREQNKLTKQFEKAVKYKFKTLIPSARHQSFKLKSKGQIDLIVSDPEQSIMLLIEMKHVTKARNRPIIEGIQQLQRDETLIQNDWGLISAKLDGWNNKDIPQQIKKVLITNWFRGAIDRIPGDILILNLDELNKLETTATLNDMITTLSNLEREIKLDDVEYIDSELSACGFCFKHRHARLKNFDTVIS